jgi:hypothetical protein
MYYEEMESSTIKEKNNNLALNITAEIDEPIEKSDNTMMIQQIEKLDNTMVIQQIEKLDNTMVIQQIEKSDNTMVIQQIEKTDIIESYNMMSPKNNMIEDEFEIIN